MSAIDTKEPGVDASTSQGALRRVALSTTNRPIDVFAHWAGAGGADAALDMDQPYQRGDVWGTKRRRNLIRSLLMGVPIPSVIVNDRFGAKFREPGYDQEKSWSYAIVDGKQRVTTILMFMRDELSVPRSWFPEECLGGVDNGSGLVSFGGLSTLGQRDFRSQTIGVCEGRFRSLAEERELFDLVNFGGLAQGEVDDDR